MREIKFRAWDKKTNQWRYGGTQPYYGDKPHTVICLRFFWEFVEKGDFIDVGEYTDRKDKNGVEIYEGDRVKAGHREPFVVAWDNNASWGELCSLQCEINIKERLNSRENVDRIIIDYPEVISNRYGNKELLGSRQKVGLERPRICDRCGAVRTDNVNSNVCGSCADDLRREEANRQ